MARYKKRKLSIKKLCRVFIPLILIVVIAINFTRIITFIESKITGYEYDTITVFHELDVYHDIKNHDYSETLERIIVSEYYNPKYLNSYFDIKYHEKEDFFITINKLLDLGYEAKEINTIYDTFSDKEIVSFTNNNYLKDIINIINLSYFHQEDIERYLKYNNDNELEYTDLVTYVNASLDYKYYTNVVDIKEPDDILVLVNKYHKLASNYVPSDLETISSKYNQGWNNKMRHVAKEAFEKMCEAALKDGITIYSGSAYRSYNYQQTLYNNYVYSNGFDKAETFSARAGYSEHQTGLATDVMNKSGDFISKDDKEYTWLVDNSYKYGFILRYPEGKEKVTGYMYEEWHFRYVGVDIANEITKLNLTYDEYIARK